jgi:hypothetical protein
MQLSNSKVKTYRRCPNQFRYKYGMKLRPKARRIQLETGTWCHSLLQAHYEGKDWKKKHKRLTKQFNNLPEEIREQLGDIPTECRRIMRGYFRQYPDDHKRYRVIDCEMDEIVVLSNGIRLNIIVDLILEDLIDGGLCFWDHKFRGKLGEADDMMLDPQLTLYFWGLEKLGYHDMRYGLYNEVRTKVPTVPKLLVRGGLSKAKNIDTDVYTYMKAIRDNDLDPNEYADILHHIATNEETRFFRRTPIPKDPPVVRTTMKELVDTAVEIQRAERQDRYPRSFETSCKWGCDYKDLCIAELHGADIKSMIQQNFEVSKRGG